MLALGVRLRGVVDRTCARRPRRIASRSSSPSALLEDRLDPRQQHPPLAVEEFAELLLEFLPGPLLEPGPVALENPLAVAGAAAPLARIFGPELRRRSELVPVQAQAVEL